MDKTRRLHIWLYAILGAAILIIFFWGMSMQKNAKALELSVENQYNRAFHDLVSYIDDIDTQLTKAQLAASPAQLATISSQIFRQSAEAKSCLGQLPTTEIQLDNTAKFLSQVGDYTYVLSQDMINGEEISQDAYSNLASLNDYASKLNNTLSTIEQKIYSGDLKFSDLSSNTGKNTAIADGGDILSDLKNVEKSFEEYPSLIYDGPFSEHITNRESQMLKYAQDITRTEALNKAQEFLGMRGRDLKFENISENTAIETYTFVKNKNNEELSISITKKGGHVLYFLDNADSAETNYNIESATKSAQSFLENHGYKNMVSSYFEEDNGIATINFAYLQDGIICYSDLIKVKVSLTDCEIVGLEAQGYLMNHTERDIPSTILSEDEARQKISTTLNVTPAGLAIIPKDSMEEILCYEFHGTFKDKNFLIYVNAENGREEKILLLIESENGILTV